MCRYEGNAIREFDDIIVRVECVQHNNVMVDAVISSRDMALFLSTGKQAVSQGMPVGIFNAAVRALNEIGVTEAGKYLPN